MVASKQIMIVAGEASGDNHAARLVERLRERDPELRFFGAAGQKMRNAGVEAIVESDGLSIVGLAEIAAALPMFWRAFKQLKASAVERNPAVAILVDFPEFNLKLAKSLKKAGIPVIYYISPQLWAWRKYRIKTIRESVDLLLTILPFEKQWYGERGVEHVEYVGNPLANEVFPSTSRDEFRVANGIGPRQRLIALLPGSRSKEISRILPIMIESAKKMLASDSDLRFMIAAANDRCAKIIGDVLGDIDPRSEFCVVTSQTYDLLNAADAAAVTSGTATLETGMIGTPLVIVYRSTALNYVLLRPLIDVEHYGLINLIAGERVAKELIQYDLNSDELSSELFRLLEPTTNEKFRKKLANVTETLGSGGTSGRAADAVIRFMGS